jgi:hypothetical protein
LYCTVLDIILVVGGSWFVGIVEVDRAVIGGLAGTDVNVRGL